jgi:hypothetical protein
MREIRWAWRNITARRWRAALTIGLLALALAATTIVFCLPIPVFRRVAYPAADRLITFDTRDAKTGRPGRLRVRRPGGAVLAYLGTDALVRTSSVTHSECQSD